MSSLHKSRIADFHDVLKEPTIALEKLRELSFSGKRRFLWGAQGSLPVSDRGGQAPGKIIWEIPPSLPSALALSSCAQPAICCPCSRKLAA
uniref:Uncharacterized protein n=1 Tax=Neovison vison TaxID=452646 RepID=A0A8C7B2H2_NEOVI